MSASGQKRTLASVEAELESDRAHALAALSIFDEQLENSPYLGGTCMLKGELADSAFYGLLRRDLEPSPSVRGT
jgi:glutathione S-transferase